MQPITFKSNVFRYVLWGTLNQFSGTFTPVLMDLAEGRDRPSVADMRFVEIEIEIDQCFQGCSEEKLVRN